MFISCFLQELATKYSQELKMAKDIVQSALLQLQANALEKLATRKKFQDTGVACLRVRFSGPSADKGKVVTIETRLDAIARELKAHISIIANVIMDRCVNIWY